MGWCEDLGLTVEGAGYLPLATQGEVAAFLVRWGFYADALPLARRLSALRPESASAGVWLVEALVGTGSAAEALRISGELATRHPGEPAVVAARVDALLAGGRASEAMQVAQDLLDTGAPAGSLALERLARCRAAGGDLPGALAAAEESLAILPAGHPPAAALRLLDHLLCRAAPGTSRAAEVRSQMEVAYAEDLRRLQQVVGGGGGSPSLVLGAPCQPRPTRRVGRQGSEGASHSEPGHGAASAEASCSQSADTAGSAGASRSPILGAPASCRQGPEGASPSGRAVGDSSGSRRTRNAGASRSQGAHREDEAEAEAEADDEDGGLSPDTRHLSPAPNHPTTQPPNDPSEVLRTLFGHPQFRPGQQAVCEAVLAGESILSVMPTGAGKSLCYQLPAALLPRTTVVISPLIALMKDQVDGLPPALAARTALVNSTLGPGEVDARLRDIAAGRCRLVYAAPERLRQWPFLDALLRAGVSLFVVDEAHCLSLWGHDFRPDYLFLGPTLRRLGDPPVLAMTATATPAVQGDVSRRLGRELRRISLGVFRPNLRLEVITARADEEKLGLLVDLCRGEAGAVVVYATARERCEGLARMLRGKGVQAMHYHAGMERDDRAAAQDSFMAGQVRVIVATVAFGMGVDKRDVRLVVHYNLPRSVESYYQEAGRGGRDGLPSRCVLLATPGDRANLSRWAAQERIRMETLAATYHAVRRAAGAAGVARVTPEELANATGADDTPVRVTLSLLEQVGLIVRHLDLPRVVTVRLLEPAREPALQAVADAARLRPGQSATVDPLALASAAGMPAGELEGRLLEWQARGWVECRPAGRDLLLEVPPAPAGAKAALDRLITAQEEQQRRRLDRMAAYVKTRGCRHAFIAGEFGEAPPAGSCHACDHCAPGAVRREPARRPTGRPSAQPARPVPESPAQAALQCIGGLPFAVGKKGLVNILRGSLAASIGADRCPQHGALAGLSRAEVERVVDRLVETGHLLRDAGSSRPLLRLSDGGRSALAQGAAPADLPA